jgi:arylesterase/paraoxonase
MLGSMLHDLRLAFLAAGCLLLLGSCAAIPHAPLSGGDKVPIGNGTEDIVLDDFTHQPRLLISCDDRRHGHDTSYFSGIVSYDLLKGERDTLAIKEYPIGLAFRPHGLDILQVGARMQLYVVCHDDKNGHHWVASFNVYPDELTWIQNYHSGALTSPNGVTALPDGSLYVTNDHLVRGAFKEDMFKQKKAQIIRFERDGSSKVVFDGMSYGNGITNRNGYLYVASTRANAIYRFKILPDGMLSEQTVVAKVPGPDNLRWDGEDLIVACHLRVFKFLGHAKDPEKFSPTVVYRVQPGNSKPIPLYSDRSGKTISAGATGLIYKDRLFIGQVFGDWILTLKK